MYNSFWNCYTRQKLWCWVHNCLIGYDILVKLLFLLYNCWENCYTFQINSAKCVWNFSTTIINSANSSHGYNILKTIFLLKQNAFYICRLVKNRKFDISMSKHMYSFVDSLRPQEAISYINCINNICIITANSEYQT